MDTQETQIKELEVPANTQAEYIPLGIRYQVPLSGAVSSGFGWRNHPTDGVLRFHYGLDIMADKGSAIRAFSDGTVSYTGESTNTGSTSVWSTKTASHVLRALQQALREKRTKGENGL